MFEDRRLTLPCQPFLDDTRITHVFPAAFTSAAVVSLMGRAEHSSKGEQSANIELELAADPCFPEGASTPDREFIMSYTEGPAPPFGRDRYVWGSLAVILSAQISLGSFGGTRTLIHIGKVNKGTSKIERGRH